MESDMLFNRVDHVLILSSSVFLYTIVRTFIFLSPTIKRFLNGQNEQDRQNEVLRQQSEHIKEMNDTMTLMSDKIIHMIEKRGEILSKMDNHDVRIIYIEKRVDLLEKNNKKDY